MSDELYLIKPSSTIKHNYITRTWPIQEEDIYLLFKKDPIFLGAKGYIRLVARGYGDTAADSIYGEGCIYARPIDIALVSDPNDPYRELIIDPVHTLRNALSNALAIIMTRSWSVPSVSEEIVRLRGVLDQSENL